jgi:hypothetical protein
MARPGRYDTTPIQETVPEAAEQLAAASAADKTLAIVEEVVSDKGYHSNQTLVDLMVLDVRTYIAEPDRGRRRWRDCAARDAVYANRRRLRGPRGQALMRQRGERVERPFAHLYRTGALRRTHLRGRSNILKRLLVHGSALNLGVLLRRFLSVGTPRGLQGRVAASHALWRLLEELTTALHLKTVDLIPPFTPQRPTRTAHTRRLKYVFAPRSAKGLYLAFFAFGDFLDAVSLSNAWATIPNAKLSGDFDSTDTSSGRRSPSLSVKRDSYDKSGFSSRMPKSKFLLGWSTQKDSDGRRHGSKHRIGNHRGGGDDCRWNDCSSDPISCGGNSTVVAEQER